MIRPNQRFDASPYGEAPGEAATSRLLLRAAREMERERSFERDRAERLVSLHAAFTAIASAVAPADVIATILRSARKPLGFERAIWMAVESATVTIRYVLDGSDVIDPSDEAVEFDRSSVIARLLRHPTGRETGEAGDLGSPLVDVRSWYALIPILHAGEIVALLYVDGHSSPSAAGSTSEAERLQALVSIGTIALDNATLLERTQRLASRDPLTGLYNRRAFNERLQEHLSAATRGIPFVFAIIDIDDFKKINDTRGHAQGDTELKRLAQTILSTSRPHDVVGRFAGDEFVVALSDVEARDADGMVARLSAHLRAAGLRCSIGAALAPECDGYEALFAAADRALYRTKHRGKDGYTIATSARSHGCGSSDEEPLDRSK